MLKDAKVFATIAVKDIASAKEFYNGKLGLEEEADFPGGLVYRCGGNKLLVYESENAGTNKATSASWEVENIEETVKDLESKGIVFESYDMPGVTKQGAIHVMGKEKAAWFKDNDDNILAVNKHD